MTTGPHAHPLNLPLYGGEVVVVLTDSGDVYGLFDGPSEAEAWAEQRGEPYLISLIFDPVTGKDISVENSDD